MTIDRILSISSIIVSCIAVPASGYLSYRYAIRGEKRKEWNLIAAPIRERLINQIDAINNGGYFHANITRSDILKLSDAQRGDKRDSILKAFDDFEKAHSFEELWKISDGRVLIVDDPTVALACSVKLLSLIPRK